MATPVKMQAFDNGFDSNTLCVNDLINLLQLSTRKQFNTKESDTNDEIIQRNVEHLLEQDFAYEYIANVNGELCPHYPRQILVPTFCKWSVTEVPKIQILNNIRDRIAQARIARCRSRFVVPALLVNGKYVCRSSTLSSWGEVYPRSGMDMFNDTNATRNAPLADDSNEIEQPQQQSIFDKIRTADIDVLKTFDIGSIVNLMVQKRHAFLGMNITASEKLDKYNRYGIFQLILLPYPGCEHFHDLSVQNYDVNFLLFDWSLSKKTDALLELPEHLSTHVNADWLLWQKWSTLHLTQKYLEILLRHLETDPRGILIHCLSGWDRTPLFISLLRLSLWADNVIHQSLTAEEILYLTLAYDWYLFGHPLPERLSSGEEILYYNFLVLPYLVGDEFIFRSSDDSHRCKTSNSANDIPQQFNQSQSTDFLESKKKIRTEKLKAVFHLFQNCYRTVGLENSAKSNNRSIGSALPRIIRSFVLGRRQ